jgi:hypothetical protein
MGKRKIMMKIKLNKIEDLPMDAPLEFVAFYKHNGHVCSTDGSVLDMGGGDYTVSVGCHCCYVPLENVIGCVPFSAFDLPVVMGDL